jgi:hypothetical protein
MKSLQYDDSINFEFNNYKVLIMLIKYDALAYAIPSKSTDFSKSTKPPSRLNLTHPDIHEFPGVVPFKATVSEHRADLQLLKLAIKTAPLSQRVESWRSFLKKNASNRAVIVTMEAFLSRLHREGRNLNLEQAAKTKLINPPIHPYKSDRYTLARCFTSCNLGMEIAGLIFPPPAWFNSQACITSAGTLEVATCAVENIRKAYKSHFGALLALSLNFDHFHRNPVEVQEMRSKFCGHITTGILPAMKDGEMFVQLLRINDKRLSYEAKDKRSALDHSCAFVYDKSGTLRHRLQLWTDRVTLEEIADDDKAAIIGLKLTEVFEDLFTLISFDGMDLDERCSKIFRKLFGEPAEEALERAVAMPEERFGNSSFSISMLMYVSRPEDATRPIDVFLENAREMDMSGFNDAAVIADQLTAARRAGER